MGMLEFFPIVLRRVCDGLQLPVLVGTHAVGALVGAVGSVGELLESLKKISDVGEDGAVSARCTGDAVAGAGYSWEEFARMCPGQRAVRERW